METAVDISTAAVDSPADRAELIILELAADKLAEAQSQAGLV
jgi:hypothetical protein